MYFYYYLLCNILENYIEYLHNFLLSLYKCEHSPNALASLDRPFGTTYKGRTQHILLLFDFVNFLVKNAFDLKQID